MDLFINILLLFSACVGGFLLPLTVVNRLFSWLSDSKFKAFLEVLLYLLSFIIPVWLCWAAYSQDRTILSSLSAAPVLFLGIAPLWMTFAAYTCSDIFTHLKGKPVIPEASISQSTCPYQMRPEDPGIFMPAMNRIYQLDRTLLRIKIDGLNPGLRGLRFGHLTDFHLGKHCHRSFLKHAVDLIMAEKPDLIGITGDFVNFRKYMDDCFDDLAELAAPLGIYAVRGNHDYWVGADLIEQRIEALGFVLLDDKTLELHKDSHPFILSGTEQRWKKDPPDVDHFCSDSSLLKIVLAHTPDDFPLLVGHNPHLVICGHTHGGQVCFPFFGPVVVPSVYGRRYASGLFKEKESLLYVSRGIGCYPPFRMLCNPEITIVEFV